jgi:uncharacterized protein DUF3883
MRQIWKIFSRMPSDAENSEDYAAECYQSGVIALGWNGVGDLNQLVSRDAVKRKLKETHRGWIRGKPRRAASWAGSLWHFKDSVQKDDIVVCPDRQSGRVYIGRVLSKRVFYDDSLLKGKCDFAHRRKVRWFRPLNPNEVRSVWKNSSFGGRQTVSQIRSGLNRLRQLSRSAIVRRPRKVPKVPWFPDKEWGRLAEQRAMTWLRERGEKPKDVASLCCGWDIECGEDRFEVKGRKSSLSTIRLTENEWKAAKKLGKRYTVLLFTAPTKKKLRTAMPRKIPDPARTEKWNEKVTVTREYFLNDR